MADTTASAQFFRRRVRLMLLNGRAVEGNIHLTESQSLTVFLATRRYYASLTEAFWVTSPESPMEHIAVRVDQVLWARPLAKELAVSTAERPTARPRWAEIVMDDGTMLHVSLLIGEDQRMTDYIDAAFGFLPVLEAVIQPGGESVGRITLNTGVVLSIREIDVGTSG